MRKKVLVLFGGRSCENEVSIVTGVMAANLLDAERYEVFPVYLSQEGKLYTGESLLDVQTFRGGGYKKSAQSALLSEGVLYVRRKNKLRPVCRPDAALNCCHGGAGEDGTLSALLDWYGIRSASPGTPVSALFMNKKLSALAARGAGLPVARSFAVREEEWSAEKEAVLLRARELGYPVVVKPCRLGSSIGISVAQEEEALERALVKAFRYDGEALVEEYFADKRDINCAAYRVGGEIRVSLCEEAFSSGEILSFGEKYGGGERRNAKLPADLPEDTAEDIRAMTARLYDAFDCRGIVRADFILSGGKAYFNELNTVPGSLACYLFGERLSEAKKLLLSLVKEGAEQKREKKATPPTHLLDSDIFSGAKSCKERRNLV